METKVAQAFLAACISRFLHEESEESVITMNPLSPRFPVWREIWAPRASGQPGAGPLAPGCAQSCWCLCSVGRPRNLFWKVPEGCQDHGFSTSTLLTLELDGSVMGVVVGLVGGFSDLPGLPLLDARSAPAPHHSWQPKMSPGTKVP